MRVNTGDPGVSWRSNVVGIFPHGDQQTHLDPRASAVNASMLKYRLHEYGPDHGRVYFEVSELEPDEPVIVPDSPGLRCTPDQGTPISQRVDPGGCLTVPDLVTPNVGCDPLG